MVLVDILFIDTVQPFNNITLIKLPPYSPELNPMEQVWSWLRQHCLSNRVFSGYEEIVEQVSQAWNGSISVPGTVKNERLDKIDLIFMQIGINSVRYRS
ncbi:hypothetical protein HH219_17210 [Pseudoalteromonas sp. NEC-BIFX-2020_015]|nr:hypothetical protein [Pseudoalteromonas sp. NEC-BIFX-2020_015]